MKLRPRPARLVFLLQDLKFGGTQRQALELARLLDPARFQVEVWLLAAGDDLAPLAREAGLPLVRLGRQEHVGPAALARLWRRLQQQPVDLLMPLTVVPNIWGRVLGRLARVPVIVGNCRGGGAPRRQHERWLWGLAHHIICNSAALRPGAHPGLRGARVPAQRHPQRGGHGLFPAGPGGAPALSRGGALRGPDGARTRTTTP